MTAHLLQVVDMIREALERQGTLPHEELSRLLTSGGENQALDRALGFMMGRDEILVDPVDRTVYLRRYLSQAILVSLKDGPLPIDALASRTAVTVALCCDVLGWLEREGRIRISDGDQVSLR